MRRKLPQHQTNNILTVLRQIITSQHMKKVVVAETMICSNINTELLKLRLLLRCIIMNWRTSEHEPILVWLVCPFVGGIVLLMLVMVVLPFLQKIHVPTPPIAPDQCCFWFSFAEIGVTELVAALLLRHRVWTRTVPNYITLVLLPLKASTTRHIQCPFANARLALFV